MRRRANGFRPVVEELPSRVTPSVGWFLGGEWQPDLHGGTWVGSGDCGQEPPAAGGCGEEGVGELPGGSGTWEGEADWLTWLGAGDSAGNGDDGADYPFALWTITCFGAGESDWDGEVISLPIEDDASWWNVWGDDNDGLDLLPNPAWDFDWIDQLDGNSPVDNVLPIKDISTSPDFLADEGAANDLIFLATQSGGPSALTLAGRALESALSAYWSAVDRTSVVTNLPASLSEASGLSAERGLQWQAEPAAQPSEPALFAPFRTAAKTPFADVGTDLQTRTEAAPTAITGLRSLVEAESFGKLPAVA